MSDGEELNDISIYDFIPQTVSAFAQLLMEKENMKAWNDIINCTEEEQSQLLLKMETEGAQDVDENGNNSKSQVNGEEVDNRKKMPAFSADFCFKRIDADLKNMLKKRQIPIVKNC